jgi:hypothetical protein
LIYRVLIHRILIHRVSSHREYSSHTDVRLPRDIIER